MKISVGVFGFGKTGSFVCDEVIKDPLLDLKWVIKKKKIDSEYASEKLGYKTKEGKFYTSSEVNADFYRQNKVDIAIDFSSEETARTHYPQLNSAGVKIVSAISHYSEDQVQKIKDLGKNAAILYSPNITLGINWLIVASKILKKIVPEADIEIVEEHFREKSGVSGTALKIAEHLDLNIQDHVNSIRVGGVVGKHEVIFGLPSQTIRLIHESINRAAFGRGAILAAKWLVNKQSGFYTMEDVLHDKFVLSTLSA